ncbi:hypothetical protein [Seonamhaeicola sp.]|uniref:hypothetical protein n=1 Tax=Seonamhaeicola sp. TaxID=1912245 RepID=UPI002612D16A|nr:hypothetical protein [Seonamhaeicola sp.]
MWPQIAQNITGRSIGTLPIILKRRRLPSAGSATALNLHLFKTFASDENVLKVDVTEVDTCGWVASAFKMEQP